MNYKFCPFCKEKLKNTKDWYQCPRCDKTLYKHSSITSSIYLIDKGKTLITVRALPPKKNATDALGGFLKYGEHPLTGIKREVKEETGLDIKNVKLLGVYMDTHTYQKIIRKTLNFFFIGKIKSGKMKARDDISKLFWQPINKMPKNMGFRCFKESYRDLQKLYRSG